jgi:4-hydroxy-tetrahydrodipicolinate reductase
MDIAVCGAAGKMGKRILALAHENPNFRIVGAVESPDHPALGKNAGEIAGIGPLEVSIVPKCEDVVALAEVIIDFSSPKASVHNIEVCAASGKAIVVGTTGFTAEQKEKIASVGPKTRCLVAPNMSLGVNLLFRLAAQTARILGGEYDVEIVEAHHNMKKDAPSGTAQKLAEEIAAALQRDLGQTAVYGRKGLVGQRSREEIGIMAVRGGDIVGEHTVMFVTGGERIELIHRAHSRDAFARGALQAALWLVKQPNGLYDMQDVLGLKDQL